MDLSTMLPLLMMMSGNKGNKNGGGMPDMQTIMQMMSMLQNGGLGGNQNGGTRTHHAPTTPNLNQLQGMLSPEMLKILSDLGSR